MATDVNNNDLDELLDSCDYALDEWPDKTDDLKLAKGCSPVPGADSCQNGDFDGDMQSLFEGIEEGKAKEDEAAVTQDSKHSLEEAVPPLANEATESVLTLSKVVEKSLKDADPETMPASKAADKQKVMPRFGARKFKITGPGKAPVFNVPKTPAEKQSPPKAEKKEIKKSVPDKDSSIIAQPSETESVKLPSSPTTKEASMSSDDDQREPENSVHEREDVCHEVDEVGASKDDTVEENKSQVDTGEPKKPASVSRSVPGFMKKVFKTKEKLGEQKMAESEDPNKLEKKRQREEKKQALAAKRQQRQEKKEAKEMKKQQREERKLQKEEKKQQIEEKKRMIAAAKEEREKKKQEAILRKEERQLEKEAAAIEKEKRRLQREEEALAKKNQNKQADSKPHHRKQNHPKHRSDGEKDLNGVTEKECRPKSAFSKYNGATEAVNTSQPPLTNDRDSACPSGSGLERNGDLWVECALCGKWRCLGGAVDELSVSSQWNCSLNTDSQHNTCDAPEEEWRELDDDYTFVSSDIGPGTVVWAKVEGYPWWPSLVDTDPEYETFVEIDEDDEEKTCLSGFLNPTMYHVVFGYDAHPTRAWVNSDCVQILKKSDRPSKFGPVKTKYKKSLRSAAEIARTSLDMSVANRIVSYGHEISMGARRKRRQSVLYSSIDTNEGDHDNHDTEKYVPRKAKRSCNRDAVQKPMIASDSDNASGPDDPLEEIMGTACSPTATESPPPSPCM